MNTLLLALAMTVTLATNAAVAAEVRILVDYNPVTKTYSGAISSTTARPISLAPAVDEFNGLCVKGDPVERDQLLQTMAALFAEEYGLAAYALNVYPSSSPDYIRIVLDYRKDLEIMQWVWPMVPRCVR